MPDSDGQRGGLMKPYLYLDLLFLFLVIFLQFSQPHLDQKQDVMPEADPGEDTVSYCALQRSLQGAAEIYFSTVWFIDGFCWGSSLVPVCDLSHTEILVVRCTSNAKIRAAVSFLEELAVTQWFVSLVTVPAKSLHHPEFLVPSLSVTLSTSYNSSV